MSHNKFNVIRLNFVSFNVCKLIYTSDLLDQGQKSQCAHPSIRLGASNYYSYQIAHNNVRKL